MRRPLLLLAAALPLSLATPAGAADVYYENCDAVRAAGRAPLTQNDPGYRAGLDRDRDGLACEDSGVQGPGLAPPASSAACHADPYGAIRRLYLAYFLREPDTTGHEFWIARCNAGESINAISEQFAGSEEFRVRYGALADAAFVDLVYANVLGRAPDAGGLQFWLAKLQVERWTRGAVMAGFSESQEFIQRTGNG